MATFIDRYKEYASEITDAPSIFHEYMAFALVSAVTNRKVWLTTGDSGVYPNLYVVLIAPSSSFRKTTSLNIAKNILMRVDKEIILPNEFSQEKLMEIISAKNSGVFCFSEFKTLLSLMKRDYMAGTNAFLTDIYDCGGGYNRKTKAGDFNIEAPFISLWGATTMEWFVKEIKDDDISSGFLARFLFIIAKDKEKDLPLPPPANQIKKQALIDELVGFSKISGYARLSKEAESAYLEIYKRNKAHSETITHEFACIYQRLNIYLLKIAILKAVMRGSLDILPSDIYEADAYTQYATVNIEDIIENNLTYSRVHAMNKRVLGYIVKEKESGISRSDLVWKCNISARELDESIKTLLDADKIFERIVKGIKKDRKFYYSIEYEKKRSEK